MDIKLLDEAIEKAAEARDELAKNCAVIKTDGGETAAVAYHPMAVEMFGMTVCHYIDTLIAAAREGVRLREEVSSWREPTPEAPPEFTKLPLHATGGADCWHGHGVAVTAMYCTRTRGFDRFEVYRGGRPLSPVGDAVNFIGWDAVVKAALTPTPEPTP